MRCLFFLVAIYRIASSVSIAIHHGAINITDNAPSSKSIDYAPKVFNESDVVITRDLNGTTHPHFSKSIGIVTSSNPQTTILKLMKETNHTFISFHTVTLPTQRLRKLNYISDPVAFQNRNKAFLSRTVQLQWMHLYSKMIRDILSHHGQNGSIPIDFQQDMKLICTCAFRYFGLVVFALNQWIPPTLHAQLISIIHTIIKQYNDVQPVNGIINATDIVLIKELKHQNSSEKESLAKKMSNQIGVIMKNVSEINNRTQTLFHIQSVLDSSHTIKLRRKHFHKRTKIYLYPVSRNPSARDLMTIRKQMMTLLSNQKNEVMNLISGRTSCQILGTDSYAASNLIYHNSPVHLLSFIQQLRTERVLHTPEDVIGKLSTMHFVVDKDAFYEALEYLPRVTSVGGIRIWMEKMQQVYETNYKRFGTLTNPEEFEVKLGESVTLVNYIFARDLRQMCKFKLVWYPFWNLLMNMYRDRLKNIVVHGLRMASASMDIAVGVILPRLAYSDILRHYVLSNKLGHDLHVFYERSTPADMNPLFNWIQFQKVLVAKLNLEWNINITKANTLTHHLVETI